MEYYDYSEVIIYCHKNFGGPEYNNTEEGFEAFVSWAWDNIFNVTYQNKDGIPFSRTEPSEKICNFFREWLKNFIEASKKQSLNPLFKGLSKVKNNLEFYQHFLELLPVMWF